MQQLKQLTLRLKSTLTSLNRLPVYLLNPHTGVFFPLKVCGNLNNKTEVMSVQRIMEKYRWKVRIFKMHLNNSNAAKLTLFRLSILIQYWIETKHKKFQAQRTFWRNCKYLYSSSLQCLSGKALPPKKRPTYLLMGSNRRDMNQLRVHISISLQNRRTDSAPKSTQTRILHSNSCGPLQKYGYKSRSRSFTESSLLTCADTSSRPSSAFLSHPDRSSAWMRKAREKWISYLCGRSCLVMHMPVNPLRLKCVTWYAV